MAEFCLTMAQNLAGCKLFWMLLHLGRRPDWSGGPLGLYRLAHCEEGHGLGQDMMSQPCCCLSSLSGSRVLLGERFCKDELGFIAVGDANLSTLFGGLHSSLLRLLATNYPHLCIVDDWICEEHITGTDALLRRMLMTNTAKNHSPKQLQEGMAPPTPGLLLDCQLAIFFCTHICVCQSPNERKFQVAGQGCEVHGNGAHQKPCFLATAPPRDMLMSALFKDVGFPLGVLAEPLAFCPSCPSFQRACT